MIPALPIAPAVAASQIPAQPAAAQPVVVPNFSDLVEQIVADSTPAAAARLPVIKGSAAPAAAPLPELPTPPLPAPFKTLDEKVAASAPSAPRERDARKAAPAETSCAQAPALAVDHPVLQIPLPPKLQPHASGNEAESLKPLALSAQDAPSRIALEPKPMLEVKIHLDPETATTPVTPHVSAPPPAEDPAPPHSDGPVAVQPASPQNAGSSLSQQNPQNQQPSTSRAAEHANPIKEEISPAVHPDAAAPPAPAQLPAANAASAPVVQAGPAAPIDTPRPQHSAPGAPPQTNPAPDTARPPQPLRSMALEFTPDGANDIKVRLSERGGDVHISLHGTDPALAGRVREGVGDLVGSLSKAGYDAEAWTPSQGRQQGREQEPRQSAPQRKNNSGAGEFGNILQPPTQENS